jgi:hypothetical protein
MLPGQAELAAPAKKITFYQILAAARVSLSWCI